MPSFSGVHGTSVTHACNIQQQGFSIGPEEAHLRMFGNAVYMYKNCALGRGYACEWAKHNLRKKKSTECACVLFADFSCEEEECARWDSEKETKLERWLKEVWLLENPDQKLERRIQNEFRVRMVSRALQLLGRKPKLIVAPMPLPPSMSERGRFRYEAYAIRDQSILPLPPYSQEECNHE